MKQRQLGDLSVSALGLGCMAMSEFYGDGDDLYDMHRRKYEGMQSVVRWAQSRPLWV